MKRKINTEEMIGRRYGGLVVLRVASKEETRGPHRRLVCKCDCGIEWIPQERSVYLGTTTGCTKCGYDKISTHRLSGTRTYVTWQSMNRRCYNKNREDYKHYGAKGVTVCDRWRNSFENFLADMGEKPDGYTLERNNVDAPYSPENCRWATTEEQNRNRRDNVRVIVGGKAMCASELARMCNVHNTTVCRCVRRGLTGDEIVARFR